MKTYLTLAALFLAAQAHAARTPEVPTASQGELRSTIESLVGFGTRHTLSSATDPKRGIGAARNWAADRFEAISKDCGGCLTVEKVSDRFTGPRAPNGVDVVNVMASLKGSADPNRVIILSAHIDSRVTDVMDFTSDAPGANDDGSGVALVIEAARLLSKEHPRATIVFAVLTGEEQGLFGGQLLAKTAKARGWQVSALLNNDIVGNTHGIGGNIVADKVRVFSEGIRSSETPEENKMRRGIGGEDDGPSRALAKYVDGVGAIGKTGLEVLAIRRPDRFQRGGDHSPSLDMGYPAVRITEAAENYDHQHQTLRTENGKFYGDTIEGMDFPYLAKVTNLNVAAAKALSLAPAAPADATIAGALSNDTTVKWAAVPGAVKYRVYWRRADGLEWTGAKDVTATELFLKNVNIDDNFFGVSAISEDGWESIVSFCAGQPRKN